jgi:hypothetical protein
MHDLKNALNAGVTLKKLLQHRPLDDQNPNWMIVQKARVLQNLRKSPAVNTKSFIRFYIRAAHEQHVCFALP